MPVGLSQWEIPATYFVGVTNDVTGMSYGTQAVGIDYAGPPIGSCPTPLVTAQVRGTRGLAPQLYFKYIKKKFKLLERSRLDKRLESLEKAFDKVMEAGQTAMGEKILKELALDTKEAMLYAKGITRYIEYDDLMKHKRDIRDGHISDTKLADFTRIIPDKVLAKKKAVDELFDGFMIFHYWDEKAKDVKKMAPEEKSKMRGPVLFGLIKESNRLYFIADWEDEFCDLTFDEMVKELGKKSEGKLTSKTEFKGEQK
jgi:hypothetical protein